MDFEYQWIDRRDEIAEFELANRPFPPLSGSVSKAAKSSEPEPENGYLHAKFAERGKGIPIVYLVRKDFSRG